MAGQDESGGPLVLDRDAPGGCRLVGIRGPDEAQFGHGPQGGQMLDGLVGGTVLSEADRVVGPRIDDVLVGERADPHRAAHVVAEDEEGAAHRDDAAMGRHPVHDPAHTVLAYAVVDEASFGMLLATGPRHR